MQRALANQKIAAQLISKTDGSDVTSGTTTVYVTKDGGTQASVGSAAHEGNGCWSIDTGAASNTDGNHLAFTFVNASAVSATVNVYTIGYDPHDLLPADVQAINGEAVTPQVPGMTAAQEAKLDKVINSLGA